jgi:hypothetical protein
MPLVVLVNLSHTSARPAVPSRTRKRRLRHGSAVPTGQCNQAVRG